MNLKSLVWYPVPEFAGAGYQVPETWDELLALSDRMVADGRTPWCVGIESGPQTGWVATDWVEDTMLRTASLEDYDGWTTGEVKFSYPRETGRGGGGQSLVRQGLCPWRQAGHPQYLLW